MAGPAIPVPVSELTFFEGERRRDETEAIHRGADPWGFREAKKLRELERENTELKKMVAELSLVGRMLKDLNSKEG